VRTFADTDGWTDEAVDLTPYAGRTIDAVLRFDTVDEQFNAYPGWRVARVRVEIVERGCVEPTCPGDVTGDGVVDVIDLNRLLAAFNTPAATDPAADVTADGVIDVIDLNTVLGRFNEACE
jgi:hypothetical protein